MASSALAYAGIVMLFRNRMCLLICLITAFSLMQSGCATSPLTDKRVLVFGGSGRIGGHILEEALLRQLKVTGVSRDVARLAEYEGRVDVVAGDILDRQRVAELIAGHDVVVVSVGGKPTTEDPTKYIAATAAQSLVEVFSTLGANGPRLIFVGNLFTLEYKDGQSLIDLGRVSNAHPNRAMFLGHQLALDTFQSSRNIDWTIATPPNGLRLEGRSKSIRWGGKTLLRDLDGKPATISPEDFAYAIFEEIENEAYIRAQFNVARSR